MSPARSTRAFADETSDIPTNLKQGPKLTNFLNLSTKSLNRTISQLKEYSLGHEDDILAELPLKSVMGSERRTDTERSLLGLREVNVEKGSARSQSNPSYSGSLTEYKMNVASVQLRASAPLQDKLASRSQYDNSKQSMDTRSRNELTLAPDVARRKVFGITLPTTASKKHQIFSHNILEFQQRQTKSTTVFSDPPISSTGRAASVSRSKPDSKPDRRKLDNGLNKFTFDKASPKQNKSHSKEGSASLSEAEINAVRANVNEMSSVPRIRYTPPTPVKKRDIGGKSNTDSFLSDSIPIWGPAMASSSKSNAAQGKQISQPAVMQRSKSNPAQSRSNQAQIRGRTSPCLRIPSPKLFSRESSTESKRISPSIVSPPILRDTSSGARSNKNTKTMGSAPRISRGNSHGNFDFERPGSSASSRSGHSERASESQNQESLSLDSAKHGSGLHPVTSNGRYGHEHGVPLSSRPPVPPIPEHKVSTNVRDDSLRKIQKDYVSDDDTALPRLASRLSRRSTSNTRRLPIKHPPFHFEPAVSSGVKGPGEGSRDGSSHCGARSVDLGIDYTWAPRQLKKNTIMESGFPSNFLQNTRNPGYKLNVKRDGSNVDERNLLLAFKSALDETGYSSFRKYMLRFDSHIIPLDGPSGLIFRVQRLLENSQTLDARGKHKLLSDFICMVS